jgi:hypothetical protein
MIANLQLDVLRHHSHQVIVMITMFAPLTNVTTLLVVYTQTFPALKRICVLLKFATQLLVASTLLRSAMQVYNKLPNKMVLIRAESMKIALLATVKMVHANQDFLIALFLLFQQLLLELDLELLLLLVSSLLPFLQVVVLLVVEHMPILKPLEQEMWLLLETTHYTRLTHQLELILCIGRRVLKISSVQKKSLDVVVK